VEGEEVVVVVVAEVAVEEVVVVVAAVAWVPQSGDKRARRKATRQSLPQSQRFFPLCSGHPGGQKHLRQCLRQFRRWQRLRVRPSVYRSSERSRSERWRQEATPQL